MLKINYDCIFAPQLKLNQMKNIKLLSLFALVTFGALFITSCGPDDGTTPEPSPVLNFLAGENFLSEDAELAANTSFQIAITASHSDDITSFKIIQSLDGTTDMELFDSMDIKTDLISEYVFSGTTGATAGSEIYTFIVEDKDGNSTSKAINITNLGDPGAALVRFEVDNDDNPFKVWNFVGPLAGAFGIKLGASLRSNDDDADKDIQDATESSDPVWTPTWTSRNGTTYKKISSEAWNTIENDATIEAAWAEAGDAQTEVTVAEGDTYLLNLGGDNIYAMVLITAIDESTPSSEFVQFVYKRQEI